MLEKNELFERMPVPKAYLKLAIPLVFSMMLMLVYNMVDMFFIAGTGNTDLVAGVALCSPLFMFMIACGDILGLGGASVISRLFGKQEFADGKRISVFCFLGSVVLGVLIAIITFTLRWPILSLLGVTEDTRQFANQYYSVIALGAPVIIFSLVPSNLLRMEGLAKEAMIGSVLGSVLNMILDPIFIFTLKMGAAGAAVATLLGNVASDVFYLYVICRKSRNLSVDPRGFFIRRAEVAAIFAIGFPSSITNIMQSIGTTLLNRYLLPYGNTKIAAMGIVSKVIMIASMLMISMSFGGQPLYGYLYGAGKHKRLKETLRFAYMLVCGTGLTAAVILSLAAPHVLRLFMDNPQIVSDGTLMLRIMLIGMPFVGVCLVTICIFQSTGKASGALALSAGRQGYVFAIMIVVLSMIFGYYGVLAAQPAADVLTAVLAVVLLRKLLLPVIQEKG